eukprot:CAMPEP_0119109474 /NCGR_PEP_ID=MMETSP1180-20130426/17967_1 /TAXON_ID=3052 ORGANISM="Chlamydomonas cf sp, Strain CCMP681" /NCGR_SAMPLE_ID=MMETSP1180 /ASSEMBLY_ACC=CAM_ASM_000741 /LENGTH=38 /DNA_ID= /DNA_START= /DNA_END= /DNA_ORIENTATION=
MVLPVRHKVTRWDVMAGLMVPRQPYQPFAVTRSMPRGI